MASGRLRRCLWCKSTEHRTTACASQEDLIDLDTVPELNKHETTTTAQGDAGDKNECFDDSYSGCLGRRCSIRSAGTATISVNNYADTLRDHAYFPQSSTNEAPIEFQDDDHYKKDMEEAIRRSLHDQKLIKLARSDVDTTGEMIPRIGDPKDELATLSDGEGDVATLYQRSIAKTLEWNDGGVKLNIILPRKDMRIDRSLTPKSMGRGQDREHEAAPRTVKVDPFENMVSIVDKNAVLKPPQSSLLSLVAGHQTKKTKKKDLTKRVTEPVARTRSEKTDAVTISPVYQKRQGAGK